MRYRPLHDIQRDNAVLSSAERNVEHVHLILISHVGIVYIPDSFLHQRFEYLRVFRGHRVNVHEPEFTAVRLRLLKDNKLRRRVERTALGPGDRSSAVDVVVRLRPHQRRVVVLRVIPVPVEAEYVELPVIDGARLLAEFRLLRCQQQSAGILVPYILIHQCILSSFLLFL